MRTTVSWSDKVPEREGVKSCVYDLAFNPSGTQLVAAVGSRVLVYDAIEGDLLHSLKVGRRPDHRAPCSSAGRSSPRARRCSAAGARPIERCITNRHGPGK